MECTDIASCQKVTENIENKCQVRVSPILYTPLPRYWYVINNTRRFISTLVFRTSWPLTNFDHSSHRDVEHSLDPSVIIRQTEIPAQSPIQEQPDSRRTATSLYNTMHKSTHLSHINKSTLNTLNKRCTYQTQIPHLTATCLYCLDFGTSLSLGRWTHLGHSISLSFQERRAALPNPPEPHRIIVTKKTGG